MSPAHLNFITGNKHKLAEVKAILGDDVQLQSQSLDLTEIQGTIQDISIDKCRKAAEIVGCIDIYIFRHCMLNTRRQEDRF